MNYKRFFLLSMAINGGLLLWVLRKPFSEQSGPVREISSTFATNAAADIPIAPAATPARESSKEFNWKSLESSDYRKYVANLRAIGCPEETVRDIVKADVLKLYEEKRKELLKHAPRFEYWKGDDFFRGAGNEALRQMLALSSERDSTLRALGLETSARRQDEKKAIFSDWQLGFLEDEKKKTEVLRIRKDLEDRLAVRDGGDLNAVKRMMREADEAIKRTLTPEEAFQYDLRTSMTAAKVRSELNGFDPTEQEFITIYKIRRAAEKENADVNPGDLSPSERRALRDTERAAEQQVQEQIRQALGSDKYSEYQLTQSPYFYQTLNLAKEAGLGAREAREITGMRRAADEQARRVRNDQNLSVEKRADALTAIRRETENSIHAILGDAGWERFNRDSTKLWLDSLSHDVPQ